LPLLLLLLAAYWLNLQVQPLPSKPDNSKRHDPDLIVSNFSATTLNERGAPRFLMSAQKLEHYPDDDSTHLDEPRLSSLYADRPPVYTSAKRGEISSKGNDIFLRDDVKIVRVPNAMQTELTFTTTYLHVLPDLDLAETDRPITIMDAHTILHAVGMRFDNKASVVHLLAQVRSQHETAKK
jgi:lipopolysaccharide export system protein LptC